MSAPPWIGLADAAILDIVDSVADISGVSAMKSSGLSSFLMIEAGMVLCRTTDGCTLKKIYRRKSLQILAVYM
jgi:hypothetical protein